MGDLQCPARVFLAAAHDVALWSEWLRSQRVAAVYATGAAAEAAANVAAALGVGATVVEETPAPESPPAAREPVAEALADLADRHRGEAALLVDAAGSFARALRPLVPGWGAHPPPAGGGILALEVDADGWRRVSASAERP